LTIAHFGDILYLKIARYEHFERKEQKGGPEVSIRIDRVRLITEMARQEISVSQLAEQAGISMATISGVRSGKTCTERVGDAIAEALGIPIDDLLKER